MPGFEISRDVLDWLLDSDPAVRWQVMRDVLDMPSSEYEPERARVATEGLGARLLALQLDDGTWGNVAWNHGWDSTMHCLILLGDFGLDPASDQAQQVIQKVNQQVTWKDCGPPECDNNRFFEGELEPCINAQVAAVGAYLGVDVHSIVQRLLNEQLPDGGWNCEAPHNSDRSSFNTTICVLESLSAYEQTFGSDPAISESRSAAMEYFLSRHLCRRQSTGQQIASCRKCSASFTRFAYPTWWHYDVLRCLDFFRASGIPYDERMSDAIDLVASKRVAGGRWLLETEHDGTMPVDIELGEGGINQPSRWVTLKALAVLKHYTGPSC